MSRHENPLAHLRSLKFLDSPRGNVVLKAPGGGRGLVATYGLVVTAVLALFLQLDDQSFLALWVVAGGLVIVLAVWALAPWPRIEFDARTQSVVHKGRRVGRFSDIECIRLETRWVGDESSRYLLELRFLGGEKLFLGSTPDEAEASSAAARLSAATGRPVEAGIG